MEALSSGSDFRDLAICLCYKTYTSSHTGAYLLLVLGVSWYQFGCKWIYGSMYHSMVSPRNHEESSQIGNSWWINMIWLLHVFPLLAQSCLTMVLVQILLLQTGPFFHVPWKNKKSDANKNAKEHQVRNCQSLSPEKLQQTSRILR